MTIASVCIGVAVNNERVLQQNLLRSSHVASVRVIQKAGAKSASAAYNEVLDETGADMVVLAHQDVYFPLGWLERLMGHVERLERDGVRWGVLGLIGVDARGALHGRVWSTGLQREIAGESSVLAQVVSIDEMVLVVRRSTGLRFDAGLPGFHLYGTDIVWEAKRRGLRALVIDAPAIHNSNPVRRLGSDFADAYRYMQTKWADDLPIATCVIPVTRSGWPLWMSRARYLKRKALGRLPANRREDDPSVIARRLGYEA